MTRSGLTAIAAVLCLAACGPANNSPNSATNNGTNNGTNTNNSTNNMTEGPTGAGDRLVAECTNVGVSDGPLTQDGVQCSEPASVAAVTCDGTPTVVDTDIEVDTTLSGCVQTSGFSVDSGVTLTIAPGTVIQFGDPDAAMQVSGTIIAEGTSADPIQFVGSATAGSWGGIRLLEVSVGNSFDHVLFENGGGFDWNTSDAQDSMLVVQDASTQVTVSNTTFRGSAWLGIHIADPAADVTLDAVEFEDNAEAAILLPPNQVGALPDNLAFGADQWVDVTGGQVTIGQTWPACVPLRFNEGVTITGDSLLTIQEGATLTFRADANLFVAQGSLNAVGTSDAAIVFTGTNEQAGAWGGIAYESETATDDNVLDHVVIEYAGGFDWNTSDILNTALAAVEDTVRLTVRDSVIRNSSALGFYSNSSLAQVSFENVEFEANADGAAYIPPNHVGAFDDTSTFADSQNVIVRGETTSTDTSASGCVPYRFDGLATIGADTTFTVEPGGTFAFAEESGLQIDGNLVVAGEEANVATFTGVDDEPGSWAGLRFSGDAEGALDWFVLEYGGGFDWNDGSSFNANLNVEDPEVTLAVSNTTITGSSADGIYFTSDPTLTCDNVLIEDDPAVAGTFETLDAACD